MAAATSRLFVYGTLMCPEVTRALFGRAPAAAAATLRGYRRHSLRDRVYPGVVPGAAHAVEGVVVELSAAEMVVADWYEEDVLYERRTVRVELAGGGAEVEAAVYVWRDAGQLEDAGWDIEQFRETMLDDFMVRVRDYAAQMPPEMREALDASR